MKRRTTASFSGTIDVPLCLDLSSKGLAEDVVAEPIRPTLIAAVRCTLVADERTCPEGRNAARGRAAPG
jgi:hypothetical protein